MHFLCHRLDRSICYVVSLGPGVSAGSVVVTVFVSSSGRVILYSPLLCCNSFCLVSGCLYTALMRSALSWYLLREVLFRFFAVWSIRVGWWRVTDRGMDLRRCYSMCGLVESWELTTLKMAFGLTVFLSLI